MCNSMARFTFLFSNGHFRAELPLARKFPGKRNFLPLAGKKQGNPVWKEI